MPDETSSSSANSPQVPVNFIDAELSVAGLDNPGAQQQLTEVLTGVEGLQNFSIKGGALSVEYDPIQVTKAELSEVITRAGFEIIDVETGSASSITDALHPQSE